MLTLFGFIAVVGIIAAGYRAFDRSEPPAPPSTSTVDAPWGELEVITIPGFDDPAPANEFDTPELSGDAVADYLDYGGPTNVPFFQIGNGRLIGLGIYTNYSMGTRYRYAVTDPSDKSVEDRLNQIVGSILQQYPDFSPGKIESETRDYFDSRSARLDGADGDNVEQLYVSVQTDSRYPSIKFVNLRVEMPYGGRPDPLPIGSAVDTMIGPLRNAAGLTNADVEMLRIYMGWEITATDGGDGIAYVPLHAVIGMNAGSTSPDQVQAAIQPLLDSDWKQDRVEVEVLLSNWEPHDTLITYVISDPDRR